jgi:hypothetical protein
MNGALRVLFGFGVTLGGVGGLDTGGGMLVPIIIAVCGLAIIAWGIMAMQKL